MEWNEKILGEINYGKEIVQKEEKEKIAKKVASFAKNGEVIGFGSGSTSFLTAIEIGKRMMQENLKIVAIPSSHEMKRLCAILHIPTASLLEKRPDWCFDGTDEIDENGWLIKGRGAAMFKEKLNIKASTKTYILADKSKVVQTLGTKCPVPVEVYPNAICLVTEELKKIGATKIDLRLAVKKDGPVITENGNVILDVFFASIDATLEQKIKSITGVLESGLFIGYHIESIME